MKRFPAVRPLLQAAIAIVPLLAIGCVPYQTYETVKNERDRLTVLEINDVAKRPWPETFGGDARTSRKRP